MHVIQACHKQGVPVFFTQHNDPDPESILRKWWGRPIIRDTDEWKLIKVAITDLQGPAADREYLGSG